MNEYDEIGLRFSNNLEISSNFTQLKVKDLVSNNTLIYDYEVIGGKVHHYVPDKYLNKDDIEYFELDEKNIDSFFNDLSNKVTSNQFKKTKIPYELLVLNKIKKTFEKKSSVIPGVPNLTREVLDAFKLNVPKLRIKQINPLLLDYILVEKYYDNFSGYRALFKVLFENQSDEYLKYSNLYVIKLIENNEIDEFKKFSAKLLKEIDIDEKNQSFDLLGYAIKQQKPEIVKYLVSIGFDVQNVGMVIYNKFSAKELIDFTCFNSKKSDLIKALE